MGTDATDATDRIIYDQTNGRLWYDPDGVGGAGKKLIAIVYSGFPGPPFPALDPDDFRIIG